MNKHPSPFHKIISRSKGTFTGRNFLVSADSVSWTHVHTLKLTSEGQLYSYDEDDTNQILLLQSLQACYIQIYPNISTSTLNSSGSNPSLGTVPENSVKKGFIRKAAEAATATATTHTSDLAVDESQLPVIFVKTYDNDKLYIKIPSQSNFGCLLASLVVWQNLRPSGLAKKWYCQNKHRRNLPSSELLVCRFKIYGPIPPKYHRNLNIVPGYPAPVYQARIEDDISGVNGSGTMTSDVNEGWFYTMGALNSSGVLNFISELDGTLLYSIDVRQIMSSEIREVHNSIFNNSNVLFIGQLKELRHNNVIKTISNLSADQYSQPFLTRDGKPVPSNQRILIEFPLHIDLEDWFVGLNYFCKREYIGSFNDKTKHLGGDVFNPVAPVKSSNSLVEPPKMSEFTKSSFRVSKKISIDIIEAKFDNMPYRASGKIYAETRMWGYPWSRTAPVNFTANPFWKEHFSTDLPISTQMIHILIKRCNNRSNIPSSSDKLIGTVYVTPDILTNQINSSSTIINMGEAANGNSHLATGDIVRLTIHDSNNIPIGKLVVDVNLREFHILSPAHFKPLERMLANPTPMKDLIQFCNKHVPSSDFENVSLILLDIFQSLGVEDAWFKNLIETELVHVDMTTRKNYHKRNSDQNPKKHERGLSSSTNVFNTLFRGSSIFSKSLEKYNLRIGQEYLEKVFGDFFVKISRENKNCEVDPRYVRLQERARRKGRTVEQQQESSSDDDEDEEDEEEIDDDYIDQLVNQNFNNLMSYVEEIWYKIYITSNDIPKQIKLQLKNFRTKVELACDPSDHTTSLNCISAFIFLRFFCPAILNPKLFHLTKNHQTGTAQRTLTLIAKILLNLANRQEFTPLKEPHLVKMNSFITSHTDEIYDYFDKITDRKNDFNERILNLSHDVKRFDLGLDDSTSSELPTTPYLIDKYLRLTEIIHILDYSKNSPGTTLTSSPANGHVEMFRDIKVDHERNVYQIGSLEFEKSDFLDLAGDNETEGFIKSLCQNNEEIFSFISSNITLQDLQKQSTKLMAKIHTLERYLDCSEYPINFQSVDPLLWDSFTYDILNNRVYLDTTRNCIISVDVPPPPSQYKRLAESNALASLKLRFTTTSSNFRNSMVDSDSVSRISLSFSSHSLGIGRGSNTKNPFKKWLRRN
ncbi:uncharacterized protein SPAPADRAFT_138075 [Spathaspora passalidarum NRRL Y-27907]|uniref:Uncharacterized protein n=1 Tax=Spathaspora passalidarum (strain NRRL Y-27907 / 11-Y1) TaxID=619300 RepID=G3ANF6_SPAPN|nr:uncharacterized protein SPAPADRAFT_138075 [Spathaspora passalidarum NRRL Y-27907]EGW31945.1 hypothetical protein SPAPADRAFT_138075 [Spathaspora passalidarum NRRL Y-27907]